MCVFFVKIMLEDIYMGPLKRINDGGSMAV